MAFTLQLAQDLVEVEAGAASPLTITVVNRGESSDRFELELEGIDPEWKAIPVPVFTAEAGERHSEKLFVKPPRSSESLAGNYPFVVNVRSLETGETKSAQGVVKLKPFHHITMEIDPKKGAFSPTVHRNGFVVTLVNLGNTPHTMQMVGSDPEDACTYEFEHEQVSLGPGQQREVSVTVRPTSSPILSSSRLIGFSIAARSIDSPSVVATTQAQLEHRSMISPAALVAGAMLAILVIASILLMPKPPTVQIEVSPMHAHQGDTITVSWHASDATDVVITARPQTGKLETLYDGNEASGTATYNSKDVGPVHIEAIASKNDNKGKAKSLDIDVEPLIEPKIDSFKVSKHRVIAGKEPITFTWQVENAAKVEIEPLGAQLEIQPGSESAQYTPSVAGPQEYTLVVTSKDNQVVRSEPEHVTAYEQSDAHILAFSSSPGVVHGDTGGQVTLSWQVSSNTERLELKSDKGDYESSPQLLFTGSQTFTINKKTTFTLTASDNQGRTTTKVIPVNFVKDQPLVPPPGTDATTTGGATTGVDGSTATTGGPPTTNGTTGTATTTGGTGR